jgi:UDP-3-O-[3-hydroxymyristoyl] glucosamine N-acyltransferase
MIDWHFFAALQELSANAIGQLLGVEQKNVINGKAIIRSVAPLNIAQAGDLAFCEKLSKNEKLVTNASAILIDAQTASAYHGDAALIIVNSPRAAFSLIAPQIVSPLHDFDYEIGNNGVEDSVQIGANSNIAASSRIGAKSKIGHNVIIGPGVAIGRNCTIEAGCVINCAYIGDNVRIGANSVVGNAGFGVAVNNGMLIDVPQFGRVIIQDNCTIGALCTIDRAAFGDTIIGLNSKLDNHCHIAHNVKLGQGVVIAAFGGISGSVEVGNYVMMGGRVGVGDHFKIGNGAKLAAGAAVLSDVPAGETYAGYPAKPRMRWLKETIAISKLLDKPKK